MEFGKKGEKVPTDAPTVYKDQWIRIGENVDGYVLSNSSDGSLEVGYYQNNLKPIKETVVWNGRAWEFKYSGPNGSYLRGAEAAIVKKGPRG